MRSDQLLQEIVDTRSRLTVDWRTVTFDVTARFMRLRRLFKETTSVDDELIRHIPVAAIAALQTMCKGLVIDLVDRGEPYRSRASELLTTKVAVKDVVEWFHGDSFTFGEVVAHALTFNSIGDVHGTIERLLGLDLKARLGSAVEPRNLRNGIASSPLIFDVDAVYRDVDSAFKLRHVLAHEAASKLELNREHVEQLLDSVILLKDGVDAVLWTTVYKDLPLTQAEMNIHAGKALAEARDRMKIELEKTLAIAARDGSDASWINENQVKWEAYRRHWVESTYRTLQGTMWPAVAASDEERMTKSRIEELRSWNGWQSGERPD